MKSLLSCAAEDLVRKTDIQTQFAIESWFGSLAEQLILRSSLVVRDVSYRILEVEFYYYSEIHRDPFCRRTEGQLDVGKWRFHRKGATYREGNYRGLDIAFGTNAYGSILLRTIKKGDQVIEGPCLVVNEILATWGVDSVTELVADPNFREDVFKGSLRLVREAHSSATVYSAARYGLVAKGSSYLPFFIAPYRYAIMLHKIKKGIQNFVLEMFANGYSLAEIGLITGCNHVIYNGWILSFIEGYRKNEEPVFAQRLSIADAARAYGYCRRNY